MQATWLHACNSVLLSGLSVIPLDGRSERELVGGQEKLPWELDGGVNGRNRQEKETWEELEGGRWSGRVFPHGET